VHPKDPRFEGGYETKYEGERPSTPEGTFALDRPCKSPSLNSWLCFPGINGIENTL
jgi:hypothetical protein